MNAKKAILMAICRCATRLDRALASYNYSFLSNEGKIFCNALAHDGSIIKDITSHRDVSNRSAYMAFNKLQTLGLVSTRKSGLDGRCQNVHMNYDKIPDFAVAAKDDVDAANDNKLIRKSV